MHKLYRSLVTVNRNIWIRWIPERLPGLVTNQNHLVLWLIIQHFRGLQKLKCQLHVMWDTGFRVLEFCFLTFIKHSQMFDLTARGIFFSLLITWVLLVTSTLLRWLDHLLLDFCLLLPLPWQFGTLFEKSNFCPKIQFWQNLNIFTRFFLTIFLVKSKLSTAKKSKTTTFSRVFHSKKIDNFLGKSKLNFWTKNEDFEQWAR